MGNLSQFEHIYIEVKMKNAAAIKNQISQNERIVRQNRIDLLGDNCFISINGSSAEVIDCSPFGIAFRLDQKIDTNMTMRNCDLVYHYKNVGKVSVQVARCEKINDYYKVACEVIGEPIEIEKIIGIKNALAIIEDHKNSFLKYSTLPEEFKAVVSEMKTWLINLKEKVNNNHDIFKFNRVSDLHFYESAVANTIGEYIVKSFEPVYIRLQNIMQKSTKEQQNLAFEFFREKMIDILLEAPFHNRAYNKPLGYAGDYQMMNQIYAKESMGNDLFSKCLHLYFISAPESKAVRNRGNYLYDLIKKTVAKDPKRIFNILSVASGPAFEVQLLVKNDPEIAKNVNFTLLDQDTEALQHAQRMLKNLARDNGIELNITLLNRPIKQVIVKGLESKYDLIYSAGLFDYFSDPVAQAASTRLYDALNNQGRLVIGNFSNKSLGKITMDIALDWHLIYRSEDELKSLFIHNTPDFYIESEEEGINLFCHLLKNR